MRCLFIFLVLIITKLQANPLPPCPEPARILSLASIIENKKKKIESSLVDSGADKFTILHARTLQVSGINEVSSDCRGYLQQIDYSKMPQKLKPTVLKEFDQLSADILNTGDGKQYWYHETLLFRGWLKMKTGQKQEAIKILRALFKENSKNFLGGKLHPSLAKQKSDATLAGEWLLSQLDPKNDSKEIEHVKSTLEDIGKKSLPAY
jgi:hypothetical protein